MSARENCSLLTTIEPNSPICIIGRFDRIFKLNVQKDMQNDLKYIKTAKNIFQTNFSKDLWSIEINDIKYIVEKDDALEIEQNVNVHCTYFQHFKYGPDILPDRRSVKVHCCGIYVDLKS